jgi:hypothetical protein
VNDTGLPCCPFLDCGWPRKASGTCADEGTLSRKVSKGRRPGRKASPTEPKARARAARGPELDIKLQNLEAHARELEDKLAARERELTEALEQQTSTSEVLQVI